MSALQQTIMKRAISACLPIVDKNTDKINEFIVELIEKQQLQGTETQAAIMLYKNESDETFAAFVALDDNNTVQRIISSEPTPDLLKGILKQL